MWSRRALALTAITIVIRYARAEITYRATSGDRKPLYASPAEFSSKRGATPTNCSATKNQNNASIQQCCTKKNGDYTARGGSRKEWLILRLEV